MECQGMEILRLELISRLEEIINNLSEANLVRLYEQISMLDAESGQLANSRLN